MELFKQAVGFVLFPVVLWLLWVVGRQKGVDAMVWAGALLLVLATGGWLAGRWQRSRKPPGFIAWALLLVFLAVGGYYSVGVGVANSQAASSSESRSEGGIAWQPFTKARLDSDLAGSKVIFVDFTADWCLSCKFNERTVLDTDAVRPFLNSPNVVPLKADWTSADPEITAILKSFGRAGVPLYVVYPADRSVAPLVLPELLTQQIVLDALKKAGVSEPLVATK